MLTINFQISPGFNCPEQKYKKLVKSICKRFNVSNAIINILITDNRQIRSFNKKYHHRDTVTDCLSFDLSETHFTAEHAETAEKNVARASSPCLHGQDGRATAAVTKSFDIIVNAQKAKLEAKKRRHSPQAELALYITHALLHNLGFDDHSPKKAKPMHQMEDQILQQQGFGQVYETNI